MKIKWCEGSICPLLRHGRGHRVDGRLGLITIFCECGFMSFSALCNNVISQLGEVQAQDVYSYLRNSETCLGVVDVERFGSLYIYLMH